MMTCMTTEHAIRTIHQRIAMLQQRKATIADQWLTLGLGEVTAMTERLSDIICELYAEVDRLEGN